MDTVSVARDHEALRLALGENKINWLGISYGTQLAANYAQLYPTRTRAMVLDAPLEHSLPEVHQVADRDHCRRGLVQPVRRLVSDPGDLRASRPRRTGSLRSPGPAGRSESDSGSKVRCGQSLARTSGWAPRVCCGSRNRRSLALIMSWAGLSRALQKAIDGDASAFAVGPAGEPQYGYHGLLANACLDYAPQVHTYAEMQQRLELGRQLAPHLQGASETWQANFCIDWPVKPANPPKNAERPGSAGATDPRRSRSIRFLYLGPRPSSTDRWQRTVDAYR